MRKIILGHFINPISDRKAELVFDGALITQNGKVRQLVKASSMKLKPSDLIVDYSHHLILPAFFDVHFHWVQDDVREMPKANLLKWLENYTFPAERKFANKVYSKRKAKAFFQRLINVGTLGGACYSSIHEHALHDAMREVTGDFIIGNVLMTMNSPKYLTQSSKEAIELTRKLSRKYKHRYALTPRFALATDGATMKKTGEVIKGTGAFIQSHLSETKGEIEAVKEIYAGVKGFEKANTYTEIYHKAGMLGPRTIMGHGIHLAPSELKLLAKTKSTIAHCPTSNAPLKQKGLGSGLFDFRKVERSGVKWALASDIGGGPFLSMLDVMQSFVSQNRKAGVKQATYVKALYRGTVAGAELLKVHKRTGNFLKGKDANFVVLPKIIKRPGDTSETVLKRLLDQKRRRHYDEMVHATYQHSKIVST